MFARQARFNSSSWMLPTPLQHIALVTVAGHSFKTHLLQPQASVEPFCLLAFLSPFFSQYSERKLMIEKTLISHVKPGWFKSSDNNLFVFPIYLWEMRLRFFGEEGRWWGSAVRGHCLNLDHCSDMHWAIKIPVQTKPGFPCHPLPQSPSWSPSNKTTSCIIM